MIWRSLAQGLANFLLHVNSFALQSDSERDMDGHGVWKVESTATLSKIFDFPNVHILFPQIGFSYKGLGGLGRGAGGGRPLPCGQLSASICCYLHDLVTPTFKNAS